MILAGRLTGTVDGRPVVIDADDSGLTLSVAGFRSAWRLRPFAAAFAPALRGLQQGGVAVRLNIAGLVSLPVLPEPGPLVRWFVPALAART
jgi:hypothetical protein